MRAMARGGAALLLLALAAGGAPSQGAGSASAVAARTLPPGATAVPWAAGEYLEYSVKFGAVPAGSGRMEVLGLDTLRGRDVWRLRFNVTGGFLFVRVDDSYDSWMDVRTLNSLRFVQDLSEAGSHRKRHFEIFPERSVFIQNGKSEEPTVENPLDDASFFFFVRSIPLEVGETYEFGRYFAPKSNPVIIKVLRRETVRVEAGVFQAIVIQPIIKTGGLFGEDGRAELWLSDDNRRILLQMKTRLSIGSLNLYLRRYHGTQEVVPAAPKAP